MICSATLLGACLIVLLRPASAVQAPAVPVRSVTFEGNQRIDSGRLKRQLRQCREGSWCEPAMLDADMESLTRCYQEEGYLRARIGPPSVDYQVEPPQGRVASIRIPVVEGQIFTVGKMDVKDAQVFSPATLLQMCPLKAGQPYIRRRITEWLDKVEDGYHAMGYIRFQSSVREDIHDAQGSVDCTIECKEGRAYSVGKITLVGDDSINRSEFKRHLLLGEGGLYNPEMLPLSLQFLNQMNLYMPINESQVEVKIDDAQGTVDLVFHVFLRRR